MAHQGGSFDQESIDDIVEEFRSRGMVPNNIESDVEYLYNKSEYRKALDLILEERR